MCTGILAVFASDRVQVGRDSRPRCCTLGPGPRPFPSYSPSNSCRSAGHLFFWVVLQVRCAVAGCLYGGPRIVLDLNDKSRHRQDTRLSAIHFALSRAHTTPRTGPRRRHPGRRPRPPQPSRRTAQSDRGGARGPSTPSGARPSSSRASWARTARRGQRWRWEKRISDWRRGARSGGTNL